MIKQVNEIFSVLVLGTGPQLLPKCFLAWSVSQLREDVAALLDDNLIDNITFKQWVSVDHSTLEHTQSLWMSLLICFVRS